ncbi:multi-sensor hybrid histidine kinase [Candidatus Magnetomorum sp. HK-1]|nr:multi-sensor hybrid histidine kinase [Candidatus Magnetomorum sp. HK-1]
MAFQLLIVEDSPTQALKLEILLKENRYLTHVAKNGQQGIDLARSKKPDLIISDVTMPVMDGFEMCRQIKYDDEIQHIPVLLLTDLHNPEDIINGLNANADAYVTKPYKESFLLSKVSFLLSDSYLSEKIKNTAVAPPLEIMFSGKKYTITANRNQVLNLLMSTYENSLLQNVDLKNKQMELNLLNEELKRNNSALTSSEERFRSLILTIPDIVYRIDSNGYFTFINNAIRRLGYEKEDLIGKHFSEIIFPADIDSVSREKVLAKIPKNVRRPPPKLFDERRSGTRITTGLEVRLRSKSGELSDRGEIESLSDDFTVVEVNSAGVTGINVHSEEKEYVGTVGVIRDISERKKAEEALERERLFLQTVVDSVPLPVFFKTVQGEYQLTNIAFCDFFEKTESEIIGYGVFDFLPSIVAESFHFKEQLFLSSDDHRQIYETEISIPGQSIKNVICHTAKFFSTGESLQGLIGVIVDVTSQKKIEFELQKSRIAAEQLAKRADEANRLKSDFLANMSHEIRTPMNAIIGLNALALKTSLTNRQKDYLVKIDQSAQSLLGILNDILDFSKIEAHKLDLESVNFNLFDVLDNLTNMFCMKQDEKQIELIFSIDRDVPSQLIGDSLRLGQILINLVNNAIKFTNKGEIIISISVDKLSAKQTKLSFSVQDTGIGMTEEQVNRLFQPFSQADTSTTRKYGGTGLGLTISRRLVEMMDGKINVSSIHEKGSTFSFTAKFQLGADTGYINQLPEILKNKYVLVIDNNETCRNVLFYLLTNANMKVDLFSHENEFFEWFENKKADNTLPHIDLILIDYQMSEKNGLELVHILKKQYSEDEIPIILMETIYGREETIQEVSNKTINDIIVKPFSPPALYNSIINLFSPDNPDKESAPGTEDKKDISRSDLRGANILLVEDNLINQQVASEILSQEGIKVKIVDNGKKAVQEIKNKIKDSSSLYDAVLMDIQMPEMDGYEATRTINALYADDDSKCRPFPIIAMTAHAMSGDRDRCIQAGMDDYITKPIQPEQMFKVLSRWINQDKIVTCTQDFTKQESEPVDPMESALKHLIHLDLQDGVNRLGGRLKLYNSILQEFCTTHKQYSKRIDDAIQSESFIHVYEMAHTIKGVAGNLSAYALLEIASKIESFANKKDKQSCQNQISALEKAFEDVFDDARTLNQILKSSEKNFIPKKINKSPLVKLDKQTIQAELRKLRQCLIDNDMSAAIVYQRVSDLLEGQSIEKELENLSHSIERLDFTGAISFLHDIAKKFSINLELQ